MNLLLLEQSDFIDHNIVEICGERLQHINLVLSSKTGDTLTAGLINGMMGKATITTINEFSATLTVELDQPPPEALPLTVILALPRPKMLRRILRNVAELGIKELYLINSYRVEKSYWQTPLLETETIRKHLLEGLSQARDTVLPTVYLKNRFKPFVEDELPALIAGKTAYVAHPYNSNALPQPDHDQKVIAIGPEGGFIDYEVNLLKQQGMITISMGERIYRVENALTLLTAGLCA